VQARDILNSELIIKYSEAQKLPYLGACIWERLRLYPPLFSLKSKIAPSGGEAVKGTFFLEGTEVAICDDAICRRKDIFGEDANIFRPERWLEADAEKHRRYYQMVDTIFGSGRFLCLGKHIAMMELHKAIPEVSSATMSPISKRN
jgi:cytochrome P450